MVFKPWDAIGAQPRHILNDVPISLTSHSLPVVKIIGLSEDLKVEGTLLILPFSLKSVFDALLKQGNECQKIAEIEVWSSSIGGYDVDEEFVEEEQLYKIKDNDEQTELRSLSTKLELWNVLKGLNVIYFENYQNEQIVYFNLIAKELISTFGKTLNELLCLTPGNLPFQFTVGKLSNAGSKADQVLFQELVPPFYITGVAASIISQEKLVQIGDDLKTTVLVLQSEGVPGFEKVNMDSIREVSFWLSKKFSLSKEFVHDVESLVGTGKNVNNFALYL